MSRPTKTMLTHTKLKTSAMAAAVAVACSCLPLDAAAAGLGRLTVYSGLGQPLRAEIELTASREELSGMAARLAPPDAFRQAGVDYASTLLGLRFAVDKRADGKAIVRLSSDRPISDPYVDLLLELNWPAGRLVREYTFLLDPPEVASKAAPTVATVEAKVPNGVKAADSRLPPAEEKTADVAATPAAAATQAAARVPEDSGKGKRTAVVRGKAAPLAAAPTPVKADGETAKVVATRPVKAGDNLRKIAEETRPEGVSLEQMLVGLFRANQDAFAGGNMNRLRTGAIIGVPDQETLAAIPQAQAKKEFIAQAQDWNNYRRKLAAAAADAPARDESAAQTATGRITAKVEDKAKPVGETKDQVKVAKTEPGKPGKGALEEDLIAKDKALNEANQRLATLEKNVAELQKLLALKSQNLAELQKQSTAKPEEKKPEPAKAPEVKPEAKVEVKADAKTDSKADAAPVPPAPADAGDKAPVAPSEPPAAEAPKPVEPPKPVPPPPPPPPVAEPSFIDGLLGDPLPVAGLGGIAALLLGLLFYKRRRAAATASENDLEMAPLVPSMPRPESPPAVASAEEVKTPLTDFSQAGPGTIDTDEVDLVAEADVYIAYGRDAQAEEILLEAQQKDPGRVAIPAKLLEIYAKRQDSASYEAVARVLQGMTGGSGPDWDKAIQQGAILDPANPLYAAGVVAAAEPAFDADATLLDTSDMPAAADDLVSLDFDLPTTAEEPAPLAAAADADNAADNGAALDFDVDMPAVPAEEIASDETAALDFDLDAAMSAPAAVEAAPAAAEADGNALDFDFELPGSSDADVAAEPAAPVAESVADDGNIMDFDFESPTATPPAAEPASELEAEAEPDMAISGGADLDFELPDLGLADLGAGPAEPVVEPAADQAADFAAELAMPAAELAEEHGQDALPAAAAEPEADPFADFDFDLPVAAEPEVADATQPEAAIELPELVAAEPLAEAEPTLPSFDLSAINLDLDTPEPVVAAAMPAEEALADEVPTEEIDMAAFDLPESAATTDLVAEVADEPANPDVDTKLDLAKAYDEMGDQEGARELLEEVLSEGSASQQAAARALLARMA